MSQAQGVTVDATQAQTFLAAQFDPTISDVEQIGEGAWSRCFGFRRGDEKLVVRFGNYVDDFENDQRASIYNAVDLPVPQVLAIGPAFGGYYAISTRVYGHPLDHLNCEDWQATIPSTVAMLEALRMADVSKTTGWGGWGGDGTAPYTSWSQFLLMVNVDTPERRNYGWRQKLAQSPADEETFTWGYALLQQIVDDAIPRHLYHADLMNRNVLVQDHKISGVFDWGCGCYGDHLYDLAWFEFWAPWYPEKDIAALRSALESRWREIGYEPHNKIARLQACYLHIGLDHLAYNAWLGDWATLSATAEQMRVLAAGADQR
ncbi:MAG: aminoglycoside phosphotransferase family protein [Caldilineaceae bacterium]|nr:aminoglycoside phosphotransferase family protein [Caldilineaceae bacterium]